MRLDQALVQRGLCESRTEAQELIASGCVLVDRIVTIKQTKQVSENTDLELIRGRKFVSRGGNKLEGAMNHMYGDEATVESILTNKVALDVGSSTGGFTDYLLQHGIAHVTSVDVGTDQFHHRLRNDTRITLLENTDIRNFNPAQNFDVIVADLSFITLEKVIDTVISFGKNNTLYFLLIKPQFEVGKGNTKKGVVRNTIIVNDVLAKYEALAIKKGLIDLSIFPCSIAGGDGNQEYFLYGKLHK